MNSNPPTQAIAIIGGGPAGLFAAELLAKDGFKVNLFDRKPSVGRKFLLAGRGGLNITHSQALPDFINQYGVASAWLQPMLQAFTPDDLRAWCHGLGEQTFIGSSGRVFPTAFKATSLLRAWLRRLQDLGVVFHLGHDWQGWDNQGNLLFAHQSRPRHIHADATLLALGGASWPHLGSDGSWQKILAARGVALSAFQPSNCGFVANWSDFFKQHFAGAPLKTIIIRHQQQQQKGAINITQQGIEGGALYGLSAALRESIAKYGTAELIIDLNPGHHLTALTQQLSKPRRGLSLGNFLQKYAGLSAVAVALLREGAVDITSLSAAELAAQIKNFPLRLTAPFAIERAISSAGGIKQIALTPDLMIRDISGVFAAGEMLDWEAPTGGYLLQACFSTGHHAARGIKNFLMSLHNK